jgi:hypothetical protein
MKRRGYRLAGILGAVAIVGVCLALFGNGLVDAWGAVERLRRP